MGKTITTILLTALICGIGWFFVGRNDLREIRASFDGVNGDFQGVQRAVSELGDNSDGFAGEISGIGVTSRRIEDRSGTLNEGLTGVDGEIRFIAGEVDKLEEWNRRSIRLGRDLGDVAFELRQLNKESGVQE